MHFWIRARTSGMWRSVDTYDRDGYKTGERVLVMAHEEGRWCIDGRPVDVQPMLCVTFANPVDAQWFIEQGRASMLAVEPEHAVMFESETDAMFFVRQKLGEMMSSREVEAMIEAHRAQSEGRLPNVDNDDEEPAATEVVPVEKAKTAKPAAKGGSKKRAAS